MSSTAYRSMLHPRITKMAGESHALFYRFFKFGVYININGL